MKKNNLLSRLNYKTLIGHGLFWLLMIQVSTIASLGTDLDVPETFFEQALFYGMPMNMLVFYGNYSVLVPRFMSKKLGIYVIGVVLFLAVATLIESLFDSLFLRYLGVDHSKETLVVLFFVNLAIHIIFWLQSMLGRLAIDWFTNIRVQQQIKAQHTETELALLKSQVQPHFLFNMLNTLYSSSYEHGDEQTANGIGKLSHLLRYMLYETKDEQVPLESEIEYLQSYIDLQQMRFVDDATISFDIHGEADNLTVAPMLFIILVENAFKHGISPAKKSNIEVKLSITADKIVLIVDNDIHREKPKSELDKDAGGLGLENLQRRLTLLYPDCHKLSKTEQNNRYTATLELQ